MLLSLPEEAQLGCNLLLISILNVTDQPNNKMKFKHATLLHKFYNNQWPLKDWSDLSFNQTFSNRETHLNVYKNNKFKVGNNLLGNRMQIINNKIHLMYTNNGDVEVV